MTVTETTSSVATVTEVTAGVATESGFATPTGVLLTEDGQGLSTEAGDEIVVEG